MWPERPTCHDDDYRLQPPFGMYGQPKWAGPFAESARAKPGHVTYQPYRDCSFCGSIHAEDLLTALKGGAIMRGSDWKYGWPHKFYVERIPHDNPTIEVWTGGASGPLYRCRSCQFCVPKSGDRLTLCTCGKREYEIYDHYRDDTFDQVGPFVHGKFYSQHLNDLSDETFGMVSIVLLAATGIKFTREDGKLMYSAPHRGYQR